MHQGVRRDDMSEKGADRKRLKEGIEIIVDEAKAAAREAVRRSGAESIGESVKEALRGALSARENVVMVRLNTESLSRLDELVDTGLVNSRSEAAAFLIGEGAKAKAELFDRISEKVEQIRKTKQELRDLLNASPGEGSDKE
jgi:hypothetical protein